MAKAKFPTGDALEDYKYLAGKGEPLETLMEYVKYWANRLENDARADPAFEPQATELRQSLFNLHTKKIAEIIAKQGDDFAKNKNFNNAAIYYVQAAILAYHEPILVIRYFAGASRYELSAIQASPEMDFGKLMKTMKLWREFKEKLAYFRVPDKILDLFNRADVPTSVHELPTAYKHLEASFAAVRQWTIDNEPDRDPPSPAASLFRASGKLLKRLMATKPPQRKLRTNPGLTPEA